MKFNRRSFVKLVGKVTMIPMVPAILVACGGGGGGGGGKSSSNTTPSTIVDDDTRDGTWIRFVGD